MSSIPGNRKPISIEAHPLCAKVVRPNPAEGTPDRSVSIIEAQPHVRMPRPRSAALHSQRNVTQTIHAIHSLAVPLTDKEADAEEQAVKNARSRLEVFRLSQQRDRTRTPLSNDSTGSSELWEIHEAAAGRDTRLSSPSDSAYYGSPVSDMASPVTIIDIDTDHVAAIEELEKKVEAQQRQIDALTKENGDFVNLFDKMTNAAQNKTQLKKLCFKLGMGIAKMGLATAVVLKAFDEMKESKAEAEEDNGDTKKAEALGYCIIAYAVVDVANRAYQLSKYFMRPERKTKPMSKELGTVLGRKSLQEIKVEKPDLKKFQVAGPEENPSKPQPIKRAFCDNVLFIAGDDRQRHAFSSTTTKA